MTVTHSQLQAFRSSLLENPSGDEFNNHLNYVVQQLSALDDRSLLKGDSVYTDFLDALDPSLDTIPYLFVLTAQIREASKKSASTTLTPSGSLWMRMVEFLQCFNPVEVRYVGKEWRFVVDTVIATARGADQPLQALFPIANAILRLDPTGGSFSSTHLAYIQLCLEAGAFVEATPVLEKDIHAFPSTPVVGMTDMLLCSQHHSKNGFLSLKYGLTDKVTVSQVQEYYLLGGMIYIGLKRWDSAMYYLELVLATPTNNGTNALMVEAYRKWILVSLMAKGKVPSGPSTTNSNTLKTLKMIAKVYETIADAFQLSDRRKLLAEILHAQEILQGDANFGLAQEVLAHHQKLFVINLRNIYSTIPIDNLAKKLNQSIKETESLLQLYIADGSLKADIVKGSDESADFLKFADDINNAQNENQLWNELVKQTDKIKLLSQHVSEADRRLSLTKEYTGYTAKLRKVKQQLNGSEDDAMDIYDDNQEQHQDMDEDMMADDA